MILQGKDMYSNYMQWCKTFKTELRLKSTTVFWDVTV
jgi:hypothetical protein